MQPENILIERGNVITASGIIREGSVLISGGRILAVTGGNITADNATRIDASGKFVSPGFIDLHVHGGGGFDFMDATETAFLQIAGLHVRHGTTSMLPTTLTATRASLLETLEAFEGARSKDHRGARFLGMHLEGPYLSLLQRGAQQARFIREPDPLEYEPIVERFPAIRRWSAAPELKGALAFGSFLRSRNVLPSIAHTEAIYEEVCQAVAHGYTMVTHLYSAMTGVTRRNGFRQAGVVESAYLLDELDVELIADGVHLPDPLLRLAYRIKGASRIALVTDAMRAAGTPDQESILGNARYGTRVIIEDGVAKLPDRSAFAGSVATADRLVRTMVRAGIPLIDAVAMITSTPARILGIGNFKGEIAPGKDADVIIFDEQIQVTHAWVGGRTCFSPES